MKPVAKIYKTFPVEDKDFTEFGVKLNERLELCYKERWEVVNITYNLQAEGCRAVVLGVRHVELPRNRDVNT